MTRRPPPRRAPRSAAGRLAGAAALVLAAALPPPGAVASAPRPADPRLAIELVAAAPDIVTPVGCTHDDRGRLLVIESHTHFRPAGYQGPPHDRIRLVEDTDGDGRADRFRTFFEGTRATMGLRRGADGWLYVATRAEVLRIRDADGDDVADVREPLLRLETKGDYPHNGLGGLAFDPDGRLLVGLGENLGETYRLVAIDGSSWAGGGEGGGVFRCSGAGGELERVATGFWNPFGLAVDPAGRSFAVDNDPDARPPCRLVEVVPTADYGYRFRYGRSGRHPLQAWDGELPGTLPMAAGTGEAPCAVVPFDDALWVSSWGANRIEAFVPRPRGPQAAGCGASGRVVVQGGPDFRPVDLAVAPDGSLVVTDWVDRSYDLHGRGRIWRIRVAGGESAGGRGAVVPLSAGERRARRLLGLDDTARRSGAAAPLADLLAALGADDPFLRQAAIAGLVETAAPLPLPSATEPPRRLACLQAWRLRAERARHGRGPHDTPLVPAVDDAARDPILRAALADADEAVRLFAVGWIADDRLVHLRADLETVLAATDTSPRLLAGTLAALAWLDGQGFDGDAARRRLQALWQDAARPTAARVAALALVRPGGDAAMVAALAELAGGPGDAVLAREAARLLALWPDAGAAAALAAIAADRTLPANSRADALAGLVRRDAAGELVAALARDPDAEVAAAAAALGATAVPAGADRPTAADVEAWTRRLAGPGDTAAGWRLFFGSRRARCGDCHALGGRGGAIGPELTGIVARAGRARVVESLLDPHREIAPAFQTYAVTLRDGRVVSGLSAGLTDGDRAERIVGSDGRETVVPLAEVESRVPLATSVMPSGLEQGLSDADLRDLLALLAE